MPLTVIPQLIAILSITLSAFCCSSDATLQFLDSTYSNLESAEVIRPMVQLLSTIAADLTVAVVPVNYSEVINRNLPLPPSFPAVPAFNPRRPSIATSKTMQKYTTIVCRIMTVSCHSFTGEQDFSTMPVLITFTPGGATVISLDIRITNDDINEAEQFFVLFLEEISAINTDRVDLRSGRFAALGRIIDDDHHFHTIVAVRESDKLISMLSRTELK